MNRTYVVAVDAMQFFWVLGQLDQQDISSPHCAVNRVRTVPGLRTLKLERGDELWVMGIPGDSDEERDRWRRAVDAHTERHPHRVLEDRFCFTCKTTRFPWCFRAPMRNGIREARLRRCYDCEKAAQRERDRARRAEAEAEAEAEEKKDQTTYGLELAGYMERRSEEYAKTYPAEYEEDGNE